MTDSELDQLLRASDPVAGLTAPAPPPFVEPSAGPRRNRWLPAVAAAAAVVGVVGLVVATTGPNGGTRAAGPDRTATPSATATTGTRPPASPPEGDRARKGLQAVIPPGYELGLGGLETWSPTETDGYLKAGEYNAYFSVNDGTAFGEVAVFFRVRMPAGDPCKITPKLFGPSKGANCRIVRTATGAEVAVTDNPNAPAGQPETEWALNRRPDGTVVLIGQSTRRSMSGFPTLSHQVWTTAQLAEATTSPAFKG